MSLTFTAAVRANKPKRNVGLIGAGAFYTAASIQRNGRAWGWGYNNYGQLGDNTIIKKSTPVAVLGATKTFCSLACGRLSVSVIDKNGRIWGWGYNSFGELGDNTIVSKLTPVSLAGAVKTFCQIAVGQNHGMAIDKNGRAWIWGKNQFGELGDNTIVSKLTPISVLGAVKTFCKISGGVGHTVAIDKNGRAWGWGNNGYGQLGDNSVISKLTPVSILGAVKTFCKICGATYRSFAIDKNGRAWGWGRNNGGELGDNSAINKNTPVSIAGVAKTFCHISSGDIHTLAIDKNGRIWAWGTGGPWIGNNSFDSANILTPISISGAIRTFCQISAGNFLSLSVDKNGRAWGWGYINNGQIGNNMADQRLSPVSIAGSVKTFCEIVAGVFMGFSTDKNGRVWGWGQGYDLGDNNNNLPSKRTTPVSILGAVKTFCKICSAGTFSSAIDKNGRAWGWGNNGYGQLGDNSTTRRLTPVSVLGAVKTFCHISNGYNFIDSLLSHTSAIDKNGRVWSWGSNTRGQLGDNTIVSKTTPVSLGGAIKTFCQISAGGGHSVAIDKNGRAWGWGNNSIGQLGDNTSNNSRLTPVSVVGAVKTFCKIMTGITYPSGPTRRWGHTAAIDKNGRIWAWGFNGAGQLGDNSITARLTPVSILGAVKTFCQICVGWRSTLAIDKNGRAWGWGFNYYGQLGDGTVTSRLTPVSVIGAIKTFCKISTGQSQTVAIDKNGRVWAWGSTLYGALGNNESNRIYTPTQICNI